MSEEKKFDWKEFTLDKISDLAILVVGLELYSHREKFDEIFDRVKSTGKKYDLPVDELVDRVYAKIDERMNSMLPQKIDEAIKKYGQKE